MKVFEIKMLDTTVVQNSIPDVLENVEAFCDNEEDGVIEILVLDMTNEEYEALPEFEGF